MASSNRDGQHELHVLAVDDSPLDLMVVRITLQRCKCKVTTVDSAERALELLNRGIEFNMVITDYWMPEMNGYDLLKKIKESPKLRAIPVVIICCQNDPDQIRRCLAEGAEAYLLKPVQRSEVSRLLGNLA